MLEAITIPLPTAPRFSRPLLTTIVATIGPASDTPEMVRRLIQSGVGVFRFNFSHGDLESHSRRLSTVRRVASELGASIACLGDLQGPKIRVGKIPADIPGTRAHASGGGAFDVVAGQDVIFKQNIDFAFNRKLSVPGSEAGGGLGEARGQVVLPVTYQTLVNEVEPGQQVLINDGAVRLVAIARDATASGGAELHCRVVIGGTISSSKGINLPQSKLLTPAITARDWECAAWAVANDLDYVALSFVRDPDDVHQLRRGIEAMPAGSGGTVPWIPIIAKIEMPQAVANLEEIIDASDAIMVARGDLGVEMDIATVPVVQKRIVKMCREYGKPCIVATQMLETMIENVIPTRAEASDVANAIIDGADAVMLSAETASGKHPLAVVETMGRILITAEAYMAQGEYKHSFPTRMAASHRGTAALAHGAWQIANDIAAKAVVVWSQNGGTARYLSQNRFHIPIVAYSSDAASCRRMTLLRGVTPVCAAPPASGKLSEWNEAVDVLLREKGIVKDGDPIVLVAGRPLGLAKRTNTLAIHKVGEPTGYRAAELA